jgi:hypothetical protein
MPEMLTPQRVYPAENGKALITCPQCMKRTTVNATNYLDGHKILKVGCGCGHKFRVIFDTRHFYRKEMVLRGHYKKLPTDDAELITIEDLSFTGIKFRTRFSHTIQIDDVLTVEFFLDNKQHSHIIKTIRVKHVQGKEVGAEFRERQAYSTELTFYLNPS